MSIYTGLDEMRPWIAKAEWDALESDFLRRCAEVDLAAAARIENLDLGEYQDALRAALGRVVDLVKPETRVIYWEFDVDNGWQSAFFRCRGYEPESVGDDEWAADFWESDITAGPDAPMVAAEFAPDWDREATSIGRNLYLVARSIASLGRASASWQTVLPLCAGYHDQELVFRVRGA